jgi:hypothetical protein
MSSHEVSAQIANYMIKVLAAIAMVIVICLAPTKGTTNDKARAHVEQQAKAQMGERR